MRTHTEPATPAPAGILGLAVATLCFAALQLQWVAAAQAVSVALGVLVFTVPIQLVASAVGFWRGELGPATGMAVLAGTWAAVSLTTYVGAPAPTSAGLGVLLLGAGAAMLVAACAAAAAPLVAVVMTGAAVRFEVTAGYELTGDAGWRTAAGWVGIVLAVLAVAVALALVLQDRGRRP